MNKKTRRFIIAASESQVSTLRIMMGQESAGVLTGTDTGYRFALCSHPRRKRVKITLVSGERIGYLCTHCDGAVYVDNLDEIIAGSYPLGFLK
jgi:hypothetical protein